jgi:hypothetical protein
MQEQAAKAYALCRKVPITTGFGSLLLSLTARRKLSFIRNHTEYTASFSIKYYFKYALNTNSWLLQEGFQSFARLNKPGFVS